MVALLQATCILALLGADVETKLVQVQPSPSDPATVARSPEQQRAVVLIHGLKVHPFSSENAKAAQFHSWQKPGSAMVELLGQESDVFAFAYGQNVPVTQVAGVPGLSEQIRRLKEAGYADIVLLGHSAGGLIARQFVEDHPDAGVTKVIQVSAPNGGASLATLGALVRESQEPFVKSLRKEARREFLDARADKKIPDTVQFVCVVGDVVGDAVGDAVEKRGDAVVSEASQWPEDLQAQGVPAVQVRAPHWSMRSGKVAERLADLIRNNQPRCDADTIAAMKKQIFGK